MMPYPTLRSCEDLGLKPGFKGKVREIFDLGDQLLLVATDRISAFDLVMPDPVAGRGVLLTQMTLAWYDHFGAKLDHHLIHADAHQLPEPFLSHAEELKGRIMLVHKADRYPIEAVVRGYLAGSGFADYGRSGKVCGHSLPAGLQLSQKLPQILFTPATKADEGHDENISEDQAAAIIGEEAALAIRERSFELYGEAARHAAGKGILIADTKFEFGTVGGKLVLIDEMLTPDSSRYWDAARYEIGREQDSMDKQILRNHLIALGWDRNPPAPALDAEIRERISEGYVKIFQRLFPEKAEELGW